MSLGRLLTSLNRSPTLTVKAHRYKKGNWLHVLMPHGLFSRVTMVCRKRATYVVGNWAATIKSLQRGTGL